ncbi:MAG: cytidine deaminase [Lachnospiraceae bacterium]
MTGEEKLIREALLARENAYCPYSGFAVGAALLSKDDEIFKGCNVENASYSVTNCAERTALFSAIASGKRQFKAIAIAGGRKGEKITEYCMPCGVCRQALSEFCDVETMRILVVKSETDYVEYSLKELLPGGFSL